MLERVGSVGGETDLLADVAKKQVVRRFAPVCLDSRLQLPTGIGTEALARSMAGRINGTVPGE
jgi:hypothetical protein